MNSAFVAYIQAVGRGQRSGRYLTEEEAYSAMKMLLNNEVSELQKGAFLMLLRVREESIEELTGFVRACRDTMIPTTHPSTSKLIDWGCYAGKRRQLPWYTLAMSVLVERGYRIVAHGACEPNSSRLYLANLLEHFGVYDSVTARSIDQARMQALTRGFSYISLANAHPALNDLIQLRASFGLRSCANTLARLLNPAGANFSFQGVHHRGVDVKHQQVALALQINSPEQDQSTLCFRGEGGEPEVSPSKATELFICRPNKVEKQVLAAQREWQIKPRKLDVNTLIKTWQGEQVHSYGEASVISTVAGGLVLLENMRPEEAMKTARKLWQERCKTQFLGVQIYQLTNKEHSLAT